MTTHIDKDALANAWTEVAALTGPVVVQVGNRPVRFRIASSAPSSAENTGVMVGAGQREVFEPDPGSGTQETLYARPVGRRTSTVHAMLQSAASS